MMKIVLDARRMDARDEAHAYLKEKLNFPEYYGRNLDALYDCLCELTDTKIVILHSCEAERYFLKVAKVLKKAAEDNGGLILVFEDAAERQDGKDLSWEE